MADHAIPLTEKVFAVHACSYQNQGIEQAREAGTRVRDFFQQIDDQQRILHQNYFPVIPRIFRFNHLREEFKQNLTVDCG